MSESIHSAIISALNANEATENTAQAGVTAIVQSLVGAFSAIKPDEKGKYKLECSDAVGLAKAIYELSPSDKWKNRRDAITNMCKRASKAMELPYTVTFGCTFKTAKGEGGKEYWNGEASFNVNPIVDVPEIDLTDAMVAIAGALRALAGADARTIAKALAAAKDAAEPTTDELNLALQEYAGLATAE